MPELTNMALPKPKKGDKEQLDSTDCCREGDEPRYPYGLELSLCNDSLKALGLDVKDYSAGDVVHIVAKTRVKGLSEDERLDGKSGNMRLQITDMSLSNGGDGFAKGWDAATEGKSKAKKPGEGAGNGKG